MNKMYGCTDCGRKYVRAQKYIEHQMKVHGKTNGVLPEPACNTKWPSHKDRPEVTSGLKIDQLIEARNQFREKNDPLRLTAFHEQVQKLQQIFLQEDVVGVVFDTSMLTKGELREFLVELQKAGSLYSYDGEESVVHSSDSISDVSKRAKKHNAYKPGAKKILVSKVKLDLVQ